MKLYPQPIDGFSVGLCDSDGKIVLSLKVYPQNHDAMRDVMHRRDASDATIKQLVAMITKFGGIEI